MDLNNKLLVVIYHSNIKKIYKTKWIQDCCNSIQNQTFTKFDICELNYKKDDTYSIKEEFFNKEFLKKRKYYFINEECKDHTYAVNKVIQKGLEFNNYHHIAIINIDDYFSNNRFEIELNHINKHKYDLVCTNMYYVNSENDIINSKIRLSYFDNHSQINPKTIKEEQKSIDINFKKGNNLITHPSVIFTRRFWNKCGPYESVYGQEDFLLWKKARKLGMKLGIIPDFLLYYRRHQNQTCK